ncbi:hypothetical protein ES711_10310 [Gelidibacter salicanalis]|uniref:Uncharacterized protein n=1 Tax=Gelidibacter salicanalis TaxID=291193 RepID=A0A5C7AHL6_9FLAO|nr:hypothetical protein [Gelidibacter salicanalis]TXE07817.1 hypothetical protein ES711_10310 [Gelidibacter salicanalis]
MKTRLFFAIAIAFISLGNSQEIQSINKLNSSNEQPIIYYLVNKKSDTTLIYGEKLPIRTIQRGFTYLNETGDEKTINPDDFTYLLMKNSEGKTLTLRSLPFKRKTFSRAAKRNAFMTVLIENSESELKKGKLNLYLHDNIYLKSKVLPLEESVEWPSHMEKDQFIESQTIYFQDLDGLHIIDSKSDFKDIPKVLGKKLYREMKNSDKGKVEFLLDYFTNYNMKIGNE